MQIDKDDYVLRANVPGLKPEDLRIEVVNNTVSVRGEIKSEREEKQENYLLQERRYGQFTRSISLRTAVNAAKAEATVDQGMFDLAPALRPKRSSLRPSRSKLNNNSERLLDGATAPPSMFPW